MDGSTTRSRPESADGRKKWPSDEDQRGLECRHCGCQHFRVIYTRRGWGGKLIRRRECRHCGKRMTTWERPIGG